MNNRIIFFFVTLLWISCTSDKKIKEEVMAVNVNVDIDRFDLKFAEATLDNWKELKAEYPMFFPEFYHDTIWVEKINDTLQKQLEFETNKVFFDFSEYKSEIELLFKHVKFYFPEFNEPKVYTVISDVDYRNSVVWAEDMLVMGLDNFLGKDHHFYVDISRYITKNLTPEQLLPKTAEQLAIPIIRPPTNNTFIEKMVYYGKVLYLKELFLPLYDEDKIIGYTPEELDWARANESEIWRYFIEKELLFNTQQNIDSRFLFDAPFSKFYLELDNESPGRLGQYIGWQIVKAYMDNNTVELRQMLEAKGEFIFQNSKFKPRK